VPGGIKIARVSGRVDVTQATAFREALTGVADSRPFGLIIDLAGITYIDSSALAVLIATNKHCRADNVRLILASLSDKARVVIELSRLDKVFTIAADVHAAVEVINSANAN
jgi:anti-sigma B factor antagonist